MKPLYRLCSARHTATALTGLGASLAGGRWNRRGVAVVYTAETLALAALECLVHFSVLTLPDDYVRIKVLAPTDAVIEEIGSTALPKNWSEEDPPIITQELGSAWIERGSSLLLKVPSAVIPTESNYLINPSHPDAVRLRIEPPMPFRFDPRLKS